MTATIVACNDNSVWEGDALLTLTIQEAQLSLG